MSYTNADGAYVLTGTDQGALLLQGTTEDAYTRSLVIDLPDFTLIGTTFGAANVTPQMPTIPAGAVIVRATLVMTTAATSGGAPTLDIGTYTTAGAAVAATGITAATALAAINAVGSVVRGAGTVVSGTTTVGAAPVVIGAKWNTAAFTAGAAKLVIDYMQF